MLSSVMGESSKENSRYNARDSRAVNVYVAVESCVGVQILTTSLFISQCFDRDLNFILGSAIEYHGISKGAFQQ